MTRLGRNVSVAFNGGVGGEEMKADGVKVSVEYTYLEPKSALLRID